MDRLLIIAALTMVVHLTYTLVNAVRLSGVRTGRLATALSLFNVFFLLATTAISIQSLLMASVVDRVINGVQKELGAVLPLSELAVHPAYQAQLVILENNIRLIILAATIGTLLGAVLIPAFVHIFTRAIFIFEETGSVPRMLLKMLFSPRMVLGMAGQMYLPRKNTLKLVTARKLSIPKTFLILNLLVTGLYTTGVLSALYAGAIFPGARVAAASLTAVVNGVATILAAMVVEPTAAAITDEAMRGERSEDDVKQMALYLTISRFVGTILAQVIFVPAAYLINYVALLLA